MKKIAVIIIINMILILGSCSAKEPAESGMPTGGGTTVPTTAQPTEQPEQAPSVSDYFPFTEDVHMKYRGDGNEYAEFETYVEYIDNGAMQLRTLNPGTVMASVYLIEDGALKTVYTSEETYYRDDFYRAARYGRHFDKRAYQSGHFLESFRRLGPQYNGA